MPPQMILLKSFLISRAIRKKWLIHSFLWPEQDLDPDLSNVDSPAGFLTITGPYYILAPDSQVQVNTEIWKE